MIDIENPIQEGRRATDLLSKFIEEMQRPLDPISTSVKSIDKYIGGFAGLVIIGGGPGTGKTALAIQAAIHYAKKGGPVVYLAYEQGPEGFFHRLLQRLSTKSTIEHRELIQGSQGESYISKLQKEVEAMPYLHLKGLPPEEEGMNPDKLLQEIESLQEITGKRALVVVDSLHYTPLEGADMLDGKRYIDKALRSFSKIQQATKAAVVCIAHQTKAEVKDKDSGLMSFSGSGTIAYAADVAIQLKRNMEEGGLDFFIPKNRFGQTSTDPATISYNLSQQTIGTQ